MEEVERRLRLLRRRINAVALQHCLYTAGSTLLLVGAALLFASLHTAPEVFRVLWWIAVTVGAATSLRCMLHLRRHWLDRDDTAWLADRRARLADRLTTLLALRRRSNPSPLGPVLLAQILALGERWQPKSLAPRRVPRSVFALLASVAVFVLAVLLAPGAPPAPAAAQRQGREPDQETALTTARSRTLHAAGTNAAGGGPQRGTRDPAPSAEDADGSDPPHGSEAPSGTSPGPLASIPDRLQQALQKTFRAQATGRARGLGKGGPPRKDGAPGDDPRRGTNGKGQPDRMAKAKEQRREGSGTGTARRTKSRERADEKEQQRRAQRSGSGGNAGSGSTRERAMGEEGAARGRAGTARAEGTFKLTLTSFLDAIPKPRPPGPRPEGEDSSGSRPAGTGEQNLNERQQGDEAVHKALVPAEYEEILRRIYLSRARQ